MKKLIIAAFAAMFLLACTPSARHLTVMHANDTHSHLDATRDGQWGVIERAAFIDSVRSADGKSNVLLLHAGDFNQGSPYYTVFDGQLEVNLVNAMGYDCVALGNHEFDNGIEHLSNRLAQLDCPVVCANYDFSSLEIGKYIKPFAVLERGGYRVGIIGLLTDITKMVMRETADRIPRVDGSDAEIANSWASYLRDEENCDIVILLTHIGFNEDKAVAQDLKGVDVIVGGHSHTCLKEAEYVPDAGGHPVPIVTDWCWGKTMGVLKISD